MSESGVAGKRVVGGVAAEERVVRCSRPKASRRRCPPSSTSSLAPPISVSAPAPVPPESESFSLPPSIRSATPPPSTVSVPTSPLSVSPLPAPAMLSFPLAAQDRRGRGVRNQRVGGARADRVLERGQRVSVSATAVAVAVPPSRSASTPPTEMSVKLERVGAALHRRDRVAGRCRRGPSPSGLEPATVSMPDPALTVVSKLLTASIVSPPAATSDRDARVRRPPTPEVRVVASCSTSPSSTVSCPTLSVDRDSG